MERITTSLGRLTMKIREIMTKNVVTLEADATIHEAFEIMTQHHVECLPVVHNNQFVGILTERDLLESVLEECRDPKETSVSEIMTRRVVFGVPDMDLVEATRLMLESEVKRLPILEKHRLVGILSLTDVARATCVAPRPQSNMSAVGKKDWFED